MKKKFLFVLAFIIGVSLFPKSVSANALFSCGDVAPYGDGANNFVSSADVVYVLNHFGTTTPEADLNGNGTVTTADVVIVNNQYGTYCVNVGGTIRLLVPPRRENIVQTLRSEILVEVAHLRAHDMAANKQYALVVKGRSSDSMLRDRGYGPRHTEIYTKIENKPVDSAIAEEVIAIWQQLAEWQDYTYESFGADAWQGPDNTWYISIVFGDEYLN